MDDEQQPSHLSSNLSSNVVGNDQLEIDIDDCSKSGFSWLQRMHMAASTARALEYLHEMKPPIVHRDFESDNLLFDEAYNCKLLDFGASFEYHGYWKTSKGVVDIVGYKDPAYGLFYKRATPKSGCLVLELFCWSSSLGKEHITAKRVAWLTG